ncbi:MULTISPECIES: acyltransferase [Francisella]|uniref:Chloramphenicol acetyltransferase n=2 Tax=Francisella TaxID=262 RepID=A0AAJ4TKJ3_9GAMM|nr:MULTISPECIES: acyltransferase [Francisella]QEO57430.1 acyltransferase [Francisella marina]QEO58451.1 acyltransferase [Francisella marina]QWU98925.1 acyltransferase [Francisella salimarina]
MKNGFYNQEELELLGLGSYGTNVLISRKSSIYGASRIHIGDNVRVDDFCVLSAGKGGIYIHSFIHIGVYSSLIGEGKITLKDYCNISSKVSVYSSNDDYSGRYMTNPLIPSQYTNVMVGDVIIGKHVIIGTNATILPAVVLNDGACVGAYSLIKDSCEEFAVYCGVPAKKIKSRSKDLLDKEKQFLVKVKAI